MKKVILRILFTLVFLIVFASATIFAYRLFSTTRFTASKEANIFNYRGEPNGATASLVNLPNGEQVLITQEHVSSAFKKNVHLTWGKFYGWFWKEWFSEEDAFEISFNPEILWADEELDVAILKVPQGLLEACRCKGLNIKTYHEGPTKMIGYPETGRRTYPLAGFFWKALGAYSGTVEQRESSGKTWNNSGELVADIDGLPGSSGAVILDEDNFVIGVLHLLKGWHGDGYEYKVPSINLIPIDVVLQKYSSSKQSLQSNGY